MSIDNPSKAIENIDMMDEETRQRKLQHDPLIKALRSPPSRSQHRQKPRGKSLAYPLISHRPSTTAPAAINYRVWTRGEEEVLVKNVLENITNLAIADLRNFINRHGRDESRPDFEQLMSQEGGDGDVLRALPDSFDLDLVDWEMVSMDTPWRDAAACKTHFRWLVQDQRRPPSKIKLVDTDEICEASEWKASGKAGRFVHNWSRDDLRRLRLAMVRFGTPLAHVDQSKEKMPFIDWRQISRVVGKSELVCQRKWADFKQNLRGLLQ